MLLNVSKLDLITTAVLKTILAATAQILKKRWGRGEERKVERYPLGRELILGLPVFSMGLTQNAP